MTDLTEAQESVLAILKRAGYSTVGDITEELGYSQKDARYELHQLIDKGYVVNVYKQHTFSIYFDKSFLREICEVPPECIKQQAMGRPRNDGTQGARSTREALGMDNSVPFMTINHQVGWNRVYALKRIKQRLIHEYHPVLDAVVADYEHMLRLPEE